MRTRTKAKEKPFIMPFSTPLGNYVFDTNTNDILVVNKALYRYIEAIMEDDTAGIENTPSEVLKQYNDLCEAGYFSSERVVEIKHSHTNTAQHHLDRKIASMTLQVTQSYNMRCEYCIYSENRFGN